MYREQEQEWGGKEEKVEEQQSLFPTVKPTTFNNGHVPYQFRISL